MAERKRNPEEILEDMLNKHVLFEKFEIVSGIAAGAGTIALAFMKETAVIAAAAPLTISIALNYFNRVRMGQISRYQTHVEVTEVQRRLSSEIQGLRGKAPEGVGSFELTDANQVQEAINALADTVSALESKVQQGDAVGESSSQVSEELLQLRNHQLDLSQSIEAINQQLRNLPANASAANLDDELAVVRAQIAQLQSTPSAAAPGLDADAMQRELQHLLDPLHTHLSEMEQRIAQLSHSGSDNTVASTEVLHSEWAQMLAPIHQQVSALEERLATSSAPQEPQVAPEALQSVNGQVNALNEKLDSVIAQLSAEVAGFQQSVERTQDQMQAMHQQLQAASQAAATPAGASVESVHQEMQAVVGPLHEQLAALDQKLNSMPVVDPGVSQLQAEQMISLQNQLNSTNGLIEEVTKQLSNQIQEELAKIPQMVDAKIDQKVSAAQPAPAPQNPKQDALSELDSILADINL